MPTGYTADVATGKITDFTEYALQCARAFGATITLRDEPLSADIPEFQPSDHNAKELQKAEYELATFLAMSTEQRLKVQIAEHRKNLKAAEKGIAEAKARRERYEAMLASAKAFVAPSPEHKDYAKFLVEQLKTSIEFDCNTSYYEGLKRQAPFDKWQSEKISQLRHMIDYHERAAQEEIERTASRNKWIRDLKESLGLLPVTSDAQPQG